MLKKPPIWLRLVLIVISLFIMAVLVYTFGEKIRSSHLSHTETVERSKPMELIKHESRNYNSKKSSVAPGTAVSAGMKQRQLFSYYALRAYPGAPPSIPHPVDNNMQQSQSCNVCHEKGGFVPKLNAFTPLTPHPEYENCLQCHALQTTDTVFREHDWTSVKPPAIKRAALPGSPPPMPHTLQMRTDCAACHVGPAAPLEIRCGHPERLNCIQCHVPQENKSVFSREANELFERKVK